MSEIGRNGNKIVLVFWRCIYNIIYKKKIYTLFRANLSNDYFTNRQDRYFVIEDCAELCDFYNKLIERVMEFSFLLHSDGNTDLNSAVNCIHPLKGSRKTFIQEVASRIQMLFRDEMEKRASLDKEGNADSLQVLFTK